MNEEIIIEEVSRMKNLFVYKAGKVISEQVVDQKPSSQLNAAPQSIDPNKAPAITAASLKNPNPAANTPIGLIQTKLIDVYKLNIGTSGVNKDGVDGKWGNLTQTAFNQAKDIKAKSTPTTPVVAPVAPVAPAVAPVEPATPAVAPVEPATPAVAPVQKTPEQIRQQSRYDQGIARQSRRNERRKGNMSQT